MQVGAGMHVDQRWDVFSHWCVVVEETFRRGGKLLRTARRGEQTCHVCWRWSAAALWLLSFVKLPLLL
jgi:hypothetical protein